MKIKKEFIDKTLFVYYTLKVKTLETKIIDNKKFTVKGYEIKIVSKVKSEDSEENETKTTNIYVLSKEVFDDALENTIKAFVDKDQYEKFLAGTQEEVKDSGSMIENIVDDYEITYK